MDENLKIESLEYTNKALEHLYNAKDDLNSAKSWGFFDILGGGFFSSLVKREKMSNTKSELEEANKYIDLLKKNLLSVEDDLGFDLEFDSYFKLTDIFLDNFFVDIAVQSKIGDVLIEINEIIDSLEAIKLKLS